MMKMMKTTMKMMMMMMMMKLVLAACMWASVFPSCGVCFSSGASTASCSDMRPGHIRAQPQHTHTPSSVTIHTSRTVYLPQHTLTVSVRSSRAFMGLLLQARSVAEDRVIGGEFTLYPAGTHTLSCLSPGDTVTHSDKLLKRNLSFAWRAPVQPGGDLRFYITVVHSYFIYWAQIRSAVVHDGSRRPQSSSSTSSLQTKIFAASLMKSTNPHKHTSPHRDSLNNTQYYISTSTATEKSHTPTLSPQHTHMARLSTTHSNSAMQSHPDSTHIPCNALTDNCTLNTTNNHATHTVPPRSSSTQTSHPQTHLQNHTPTNSPRHAYSETPLLKHTLTQPHTPTQTVFFSSLNPAIPTPLSLPPESPFPTPPSIPKPTKLKQTVLDTNSTTLPEVTSQTHPAPTSEACIQTQIPPTTMTSLMKHTHIDGLKTTRAIHTLIDYPTAFSTTFAPNTHSTNSATPTLRTPTYTPASGLLYVSTLSPSLHPTSPRTTQTPLLSSLTTHTYIDDAMATNQGRASTLALFYTTHIDTLPFLNTHSINSKDLLHLSTPPPSLHPVTLHTRMFPNVITQASPTLVSSLTTHTYTDGLMTTNQTLPGIASTDTYTNTLTTTTTEAPKTHTLLGVGSTLAPYYTTQIGNLPLQITHTTIPTLMMPTYTPAPDLLLASTSPSIHLSTPRIHTVSNAPSQTSSALVSSVITHTDGLATTNQGLIAHLLRGIASTPVPHYPTQIDTLPFPNTHPRNSTISTLSTPTLDTPEPGLIYTNSPRAHTVPNITTNTYTNTLTTTAIRTLQTSASTLAPHYYGTLLLPNTHSTNSSDLLHSSTPPPSLYPDPSPVPRRSLSEPPMESNPDPDPYPPQRPREPGRVPEEDVVKPERMPGSELGLLLGLAGAGGMGAAVALRYLQRKHCSKRTAVSLGEHGHRDRGIIHVQECGDLVQVRRIRENSFLLLQAEYNLITAPGS